MVFKSMVGFFSCEEKRVLQDINMHLFLSAYLCVLRASALNSLLRLLFVKPFFRQNFQLQ